MVFGVPIPVSDGEDLIGDLLREVAVYDFLAHYFVCLLLDGEGIPSRVNGEVVVEEVEEDAVVLLLGCVVGEESDEAVALVGELGEEFFVYAVK